METEELIKQLGYQCQINDKYEARIKELEVERECIIGERDIAIDIVKRQSVRHKKERAARLVIVKSLTTAHKLLRECYKLYNPRETKIPLAVAIAAHLKGGKRSTMTDRSCQCKEC